MKNKILLLTVLAPLLLANTFAQQKKTNPTSKDITQKELVGTWQKDFDRVGNGLMQNFQFSANGTFILDMTGNFDDARSVVKLKGKYRLDGDKLFFTITSKFVVDGKLQIAESAVTNAIFEFDSAETKEIKETDPKEMSDPCYINYIKKGRIDLNNQKYYKVYVPANQR